MKVSVAPATVNTVHRCQCPPMHFPGARAPCTALREALHSLLSPLTSVGPAVHAPCLVPPPVLACSASTPPCLPSALARTQYLTCCVTTEGPEPSRPRPLVPLSLSSI